jgi:HD-GYP domain-containing protein (c-di-GMP phosphodiesterase class II)
VAYIAVSMARKLDLPEDRHAEVLHAAALHDIGLIRVEDKLTALQFGDLEKVAWHGEAGYVLLRDNPLFAGIAEIIRHHHIVWADGAGEGSGDREVPFATHILAMADAVERAIDRSVPVLDQAARISEWATAFKGKRFHPDCVKAFQELAGVESFWLDCVCERIYSVLLEQIDWPLLTIDERALEPIAKVFARVVDAGSRWTATHSAGVTSTAVALAKRLKLSLREQVLMRSAGYLHDLGKLTVPAAILDKPGKLSPQDWSIMKGHTYHTFRILNTIGGMPQICEWAAFHHERLDGTGYPFHHAAKDLTLGSRIVAVADVFTALTEERPYRQGMERGKATSILDKLVAGEGLDGDVVSALKADYEEIDALRRDDQAAYGERQRRLRELDGSGQPVPA